MTRDLREGAGRLGALRFTVIDTAGLEEATDASLPGRMRALTERAVDAADVCLFLIDARAGVTPVDRTLAELLRKRAARVILVANKAEGRAAEAGLIEAWELGLGEPVALSAEHGIGMDDLLRALEPVAEGFPDAAEVVEVDGGDRRQRRRGGRGRRRCRRGGRSRSRSSGGRTPASRRWSTRSSARSGC